jgi:hypothetical protein
VRVGRIGIGTRFVLCRSLTGICSRTRGGKENARKERRHEHVMTGAPRRMLVGLRFTFVPFPRGS